MSKNAVKLVYMLDYQDDNLPSLIKEGLYRIAQDFDLWNNSLLEVVVSDWEGRLTIDNENNIDHDMVQVAQYLRNMLPIGQDLCYIHYWW